MMATLHSTADQAAAPMLSSVQRLLDWLFSSFLREQGVLTGWIIGVGDDKETVETKNGGDHNTILIS